MISRLAILPLVLAAAFVLGCSKESQPSQMPASSAAAPDASSATMPSAPGSSAPASGSDADQIRQAVIDHVRNDRGVNMSAMDMSVDLVNVNGDQAQANATFRVKQGGATMTMVYSLQRHGNGWLVVNGQPSDGQFVHPPMDRTHSGVSASPGAPEMPDVREFLKTHPSTTGQPEAH
ncbi:MAG TPA: hypothetical protein VEJ00_05655 [Candidatus Acidoferrales bacterium]|nr:hypothetical protein [Candidatus Acidoferrales bacterium]